MSSFCPQCGSQIQPNAKFCTNCGFSIDQSQGQDVQQKTKEYKHPLGKIIALVTTGFISLALIISIVIIISKGYLTPGGKIKPPSISISGDNSNNVFSAFGETAMFDYNKMEDLWKELEVGTVGDAQFAEAGVKLVAKVKNAQGEEENHEIDAGFNSPTEDLTFVVEVPSGINKDVHYTDGVGEPKRIIPVDGRYNIKLDKDKEKQGYIGVLIAKNKNWHGFEWFPISLSVELKGSEMTITFFDGTGSILTGTYDKATGKFRGKDNSDMGDNPWSVPVWKLKETTIQFDTEAQPIIAKGITDSHDKEVASDSDDPDKAVIILDLIAEIEMIKVSD